jgi:uncharacterized membrane protein
VLDRLSLQPVASYWIIALIMAVILAALWIGPRMHGLDQARRRNLFLVRGLLTLLVLLALFRPGIVSSVKQKQTGIIAVLLDVSRSMTLPHLATGPSRWESLQAMLKNSVSALAKLREENIEVRFYAFGNSLKPLDVEGDLPQVPAAPTDSESDIGTALYSAIDLVRDQRLLSILMASDGVQNVSDPDVELVQATRLLEDSQTPLITIPFGQSVETREFADISVENMPDQFTMWVKNDLVVSATIRARGFANQEVPIQLIVTDSDGNEQVVDTVRQSFTRQSEAVTVDLRYTADKVGQFRLKVRAEPQPGEVSPRNNELPAFLTVNEGGLRVLYVYGSLNWEQAFLQRTLAAYQDIQLDSLHIDLRDRSRWPLNESRPFSDPRYDVFILHDVDARALYERGVQEENLQVLTSAVLGGKGLMMIGGYHSFGAGLYARTPLEQVLPVEMEISEKQDFDAPIRPDIQIDRELKAVVVSKHFITQLGDPNENAAIWALLPPLAGANRFGGIKDTAGVLLESSGGDPLLVAARVGGRVLAFAGDSTYKWYGHGFADLHRRFWRQVILWLAFKDNQSGQNVRIDLPQRRFQPNANIRFTVEANSAANELVTDAQFAGTLVNPAGDRAPLTILSGGQSRVDRKLVETPGIYRIEVAASRNGESLGEAAAEFVVFDNDKETANPAADTEQLKRLSDRTADFGGRMIAPSEVPTALQEIVKLAPKLEIDVPVKWQLGDTSVDATLFLLLFACLLTLDWWLRKKWGLV